MGSSGADEASNTGGSVSNTGSARRRGRHPFSKSLDTMLLT
jgi:hypothetical protein